jgi:sulfoxide reductase heme-binding subunit YedZ
MSDLSRISTKPSRALWQVAAWAAGGFILVAGFLLATLLAQTPIGSTAGNFLSWLFATQTTQVTWYITRAAGLTAYLVLWLSVVWGLAVSNKILNPFLHGAFTYDFHEFLSLLAIGFTALHLGALLFDRYMPYNLAQILVPFLSPYRPFWVGIGVIGFYLVLLVTVTFYMRGRIGMKAFRTIHMLSLVSYIGVALHGLFSGTDAPLPTVQLMYAGTFLVTVFFLSYWLILLAQKKQAKRALAQVKV